jgi:hypothetical protein
MTNTIQISQAQQAYLELCRTNDAITHFLNEQIRDAVEAIEGEVIDDLTISANGRINMYQDGTREFIWKDKAVLVVQARQKPDSGDVEVFAMHNYNEAFEVTMEESDAKVYSDVIAEPSDEA